MFSTKSPDFLESPSNTGLSSLTATRTANSRNSANSHATGNTAIGRRVTQVLKIRGIHIPKMIIRN
jgi:hypothetical protein